MNAIDSIWQCNYCSLSGNIFDLESLLNKLDSSKMKDVYNPIKSKKLLNRKLSKIIEMLPPDNVKIIKELESVQSELVKLQEYYESN